MQNMTIIDLLVVHLIAVCVFALAVAFMAVTKLLDAYPAMALVAAGLLGVSAGVWYAT